MWHVLKVVDGDVLTFVAFDNLEEEGNLLVQPTSRMYGQKKSEEVNYASLV